VILGVFRQEPTREETPMALDDSALSELLEMFRSGEGVDLIRESVRLVLQELIETEAAEAIGAQRYERSESRTTERNGHRSRLLATQAGDVELKIPKLRSGSFFPSLLEPRRRIDQALYAVIAQAYVEGVSTRSVDDLVQASGIGSGISRSQVSRICARLDVQVSAFKDRPLGHVEFPYVYLDATYLKVRDPNLHQVVSKAVVVATGITTGGDREVLGLAVGDSEAETFWSEFLRTLRHRGLGGVRLVISDAHDGLTKAVRRNLQGASWQRSSVHYPPGGLVRWPASLRRDGPVGHPHRRERAMAA
jgi:putative transposase